MEVCQEKVCCVSLKTNQVVTGDDQEIQDDEVHGDDEDCEDDHDDKDYKRTDKSCEDENADVIINDLMMGSPFSCLKC